jgi:hypothetical protein
MDFKKSRTIFLIGFLALVIIWMVVFSGQISDLNRLTSEYEQSQETIIALTATTGALSTEVVRAGSDVAVAEWAYKLRKWIRPGDHSVAVIPVDGTPVVSVPIATPTPRPENLFRVWWELYFDTKP